MSALISAINPQKYGKLLAKVRPTVIRTEDENNRMLALVEKLMAKGESLSPEEGALLRLLGKLIADFEEEFYDLEDAAPHEVLNEMFIETVNHKSPQSSVGAKSYEVICDLSGTFRSYGARNRIVFRVYKHSAPNGAPAS
jgi:HTH-type transcriptional regulator/antitoxin HigA